MSSAESRIAELQAALNSVSTLAERLKRMPKCHASIVEEQPCIVQDVRFIGRELARISSAALPGPAANIALITADPALLAVCEEAHHMMTFPEPMDVEEYKTWRLHVARRMKAIIDQAKDGAA